MAYRVPFNRRRLVGQELTYIRQAIDNAHLAGGGAFTTRCEREIEKITGTPRAFLTVSCTAALEMAALLLDFQAGDDFLLPSFTFVSTANAFVLRGARPVFCDIRADTLNLDESLVESRLTERTRAIVPVHYAGVACEMGEIARIAAKNGLAVVEDNAHGFLGLYEGRPLGSFGRLAALSFHETKNISCGEGGALLVNDPLLIERAEILREKGANRAAFARRETSRYEWKDLGSSFLPSELLAAFLLAQLERRGAIQDRRREIWDRYARELSAWSGEQGVRLPPSRAGAESPWHLFFLILPSRLDRDGLIEHLKEAGVQAVFHYTPLHVSEMGRRLGGGLGDCPVAEWAADRIVRLPLHDSLTERDQTIVIEAVRRYRTVNRTDVKAYARTASS